VIVGFFGVVGVSRQLASAVRRTTTRSIGLSIAVPILLVAGCDDGSGYTGDYELVSIVSGACEVAGGPQPISDEVRWFQLADVETPSGLLVGYFPCVAPGECRAEHDLYRSFGRDGDRWVTTVAVALDPGCTLRYRERTLGRVDDTTIRIDDIAHEELDPGLSGETCAIEEARRRGTSMPCVERTEQRAEVR